MPERVRRRQPVPQAPLTAEVVATLRRRYRRQALRRVRVPPLPSPGREPALQQALPGLAPGRGRRRAPPGKRRGAPTEVRRVAPPLVRAEPEPSQSRRHCLRRSGRPRRRQRQARRRPAFRRPEPAAVPDAAARRCRWQTPSRRRCRTPPANAGGCAACAAPRERQRRQRPEHPRRHAPQPGWQHPAQRAEPARRDGRAAGPARVLPASGVRLGSCVQSRTQLVHRIAQPRFHGFPAHAGDLADLLQAQFLIQP